VNDAGAWLSVVESMRIVVALLLSVHGLLHLMGFLKAWRLAVIPQLSGRAIVPLSDQAFRIIGVLWLTAAVTLVLAAVLRLSDREWWWYVGGAGVALSQALVILQWGDAWAGTVVNVVLAVAIATSGGIDRFHRANASAARALLSRASVAAAPVVSAQELAPLPLPVQRWLTRSGAVGRPRARTVRLRQRGGLRTAPDQPYMTADAEQYFIVDEPGFVWTVDVTMMRVVPVVGRDSFIDGRGRMYIAAGGLVPVADGTGPTFDQGTAQRFLGEIIWFPSAALAPYISWRAMGDRHAEATLTFRNVQASAVFEFDDLGRVRGIAADRYLSGKTLERWIIPVTEWGTLRGIEMPVRGGAVWKLASGDFDYYQWQILDVEVNSTRLWGER
jgi:hypothetical protein